MEKVVILRCPAYEKDALRTCMEEAFSHFGGIEEVFKPGEKILLKPNLLVKAAAESGVVTHPLLINTAADIVKKAGGIPHVGDSPAFGSVNQVATACGLSALLQKTGIPIVSFGGNRHCGKDVSITRNIGDFQKILNLPKLKAHTQMLFTAAVKNLYGLVSGKAKAWRHFAVRGDCEKFSLMLLGIYDRLHPAFTIVDAVDIMEKKGPTGGVVKRAGYIFAGVNCISIDRVICEAFGINPLDVPLLRAARKYGYAGYELDQIEILGHPIPQDMAGVYLFPKELHGISFSLLRVIRSVLRHIRIKYGK